MKVIAHIDIDSFFVSVERINNPQLENLPIAIAEDHQNSIATSLSYEAKNLGAKVPWLVKKIKNIIPNLIVIKPKFSLYSSISIKFFNYIKKHFTNNIEIVSIDECYLDLTNFAKNFSSYEEMGFFIRDKIKKDLNLPISIGISHNKFLAKMSTNLAKPFSIKYLSIDAIEKTFFPLKISAFFGIGKSSVNKLEKLNIFTIEDFIKRGRNDKELIKIFGIRLKEMFDNFYCLYEEKIKSDFQELKSISIYHTFPNYKSGEYKEIIFLLKNLSTNVTFRLKERKLKTNKIVLSISYGYNQKNINKSLKTYFLNDEKIIFNLVNQLFLEIWNEQDIKGIGISLFNLKKDHDLKMQTSLFDKTENKILNNIINNVNAKLGKKKLETLKEKMERDKRTKIRDKKFGENYKN